MTTNLDLKAPDENKDSGFELKEIQQSLFKSTHSLGHCVDLNFKMGKGIALEFRKRFGKEVELKKQNLNEGQVAFIYDEQSKRMIYYLITKKHHLNIPTYSMVRKCLVQLRLLLEKHEETVLALPKIACGLDKLHWIRVKHILKEVFWTSNIKINIHIL